MTQAITREQMTKEQLISEINEALTFFVGVDTIAHQRLNRESKEQVIRVHQRAGVLKVLEAKSRMLKAEMLELGVTESVIQRIDMGERHQHEGLRVTQFKYHLAASEVYGSLFANMTNEDWVATYIDPDSYIMWANALLDYSPENYKVLVSR